MAGKHRDGLLVFGKAAGGVCQKAVDEGRLAAGNAAAHSADAAAVQRGDSGHMQQVFPHALQRAQGKSRRGGFRPAERGNIPVEQFQKARDLRGGCGRGGQRPVDERIVVQSDGEGLVKGPQIFVRLLEQVLQRRKVRKGVVGCL